MIKLQDYSLPSWREFNWSSRADIKHWEIQILIYFQNNNLVLIFWNHEHLSGLLLSPVIAAPEFKVPDQDCSPKPCEVGEGGKQKGAGYLRAESLPECAGPWRHRAASSARSSGSFRAHVGRRPTQGTEQMNSSLVHTSQEPDVALHQLQVPAFGTLEAALITAVR